MVADSRTVAIAVGRNPRGTLRSPWVTGEDIELGEEDIELEEYVVENS